MNVLSVLSALKTYSEASFKMASIYNYVGKNKKMYELWIDCVHILINVS